MTWTAIVTDSTADLPDEIISKYGIHVVNNYIVIDNNSLEDRQQITREEFYNRMPQMVSFPKTATASPGTYQRLYEQLLQSGINFILSIHASSKLSGIYNAAHTAAQYFRGKVQVIDSLNISMGLGFQVLLAAEAVRNGVTINKVISKLTDLRERLRVVAMLDTLDYIHKGGRVSWVKARLGDFFQIKPLMEICNGQVISLGSVRTRHKGAAYLCKMISNLHPLENLAILHSNAEKEARQFLSMVGSIAPANTYIVNVTSVIGSHTGPNGLGFAAIRKDS